MFSVFGQQRRQHVGFLPQRLQLDVARQRMSDLARRAAPKRRYRYEPMLYDVQ
jgi:hypothetical protein